jgi:hypothetical protein
MGVFLQLGPTPITGPDPSPLEFERAYRAAARTLKTSHRGKIPQWLEVSGFLSTARKITRRLLC